MPEGSCSMFVSGAVVQARYKSHTPATFMLNDFSRSAAALLALTPGGLHRCQRTVSFSPAGGPRFVFDIRNRGAVVTADGRVKFLLFPTTRAPPCVSHLSRQYAIEPCGLVSYYFDIVLYSTCTYYRGYACITYQ